MPFTPRHMRKGAKNSGGPKEKEKQRAFKRAKNYSDRFIHQSASMLEGPMAQQYEAYKGVVDRNALRKGK